MPADLDLTQESLADHASCTGYWLQVSKNDKRVIITAAAHAERACAFLHGSQPKAVVEIDEELEAA